MDGSLIGPTQTFEALMEIVDIDEQSKSWLTSTYSRGSSRVYMPNPASDPSSDEVHLQRCVR